MNGKILILNHSLDAGIAKCPALNSTLGEYGPLIKNGCAMIAPGSNNTMTNVTATGSNSTTTNATNSTASASPSAQSDGFAVQASFLSLLAVALIF